MPYLDLVRDDGTHQHLPFDEGRTFIGRGGSQFRLESAVRKGSNGVVFHAVARDQNGRTFDCAVKLLTRLDGVRRDRFANEVRILELLDHPQISRIFDSGEERFDRQSVSVPWSAMSLGGTNLRQWVGERGPLETNLLVRIARQLCDALTHVHRQTVIHRDLKPANIVWKSDDHPSEIMLIDFGIAKQVGEDVAGRPMDALTVDGEFVGPQNFASPELLRYAIDKLHPVDHRSDIFQLGKILWFLATSHTLAGIPSKRADPTDGKLLGVVSALIAEDPNDRPATCDQVAIKLANAFGI